MKFVKIAVPLLIVVLLACGGLSYWILSTVKSPHEHNKADQFITIEKGTTPKQIIAKLSDEGIIASSTATLLYVRLFGDPSKMQAGEYQFSSPITPLQVLKELEKGETQTTKLTIPEGFTRFDIAKRMAEWNIRRMNAQGAAAMPTAEFEAKRIVDMMDDASLISDIAPEAKNLEGYMYPSTYVLSADTTPEKLIRIMVEQFKKVWKPEWSAAARSSGRSPHEIVTIASLIETETGVESERPIVAGVINNRLSKNMPLGIDQTNVYIAKMMGRWDKKINVSDLTVDSPYNTRIKVGLPPGPISSVSESAIKAALFPDKNDYIFYVRNVDLNDGSHWFYSSAAEFEKGKAKYQAWLKKQDE